MRRAAAMKVTRLSDEYLRRLQRRNEETFIGDALDEIGWPHSVVFKKFPLA